MKVCIFGSRDFTNYDALLRTIDEYLKYNIIEIVSGGCKGADKLGERYALENNIHIERFIPNWSRYGKSAGPIRNKEMSKYCDIGICLWDGKSSGTRSMINMMKLLDKKVYYYITKHTR